MGTDTPASPSFLRRHRLLLAVACLALLLAAGGAGVVYYAQAIVNSQTVKPRLEAALSKHVGRTVTLGGPIRLRLLPYIGVELEDVAVASSADGDDSFGTRPLVSCERLEAEVAVWPLISRGRLEVERLELTAPSVRLMVSANGQTNYAGLFPSGDATPLAHGPVRVELPYKAGRLTLTEGTLLYEDMQRGALVRLQGLEFCEDAGNTFTMQAGITGHDDGGDMLRTLSGSFSLAGVLSARESVRGIDVDDALLNGSLVFAGPQHAAKAAPSAGLAADISARFSLDLGAELFELASFTAQGGGASLSASGTARDLLSAPQASLHTELQTDDLEQFAAALGLHRKLIGRSGRPALPARLAGTLDVAPHRLAVRDLQLASGDSQLQGTLVLENPPAGPRYVVRLAAKRLDLGTLFPFHSLEEPAPQAVSAPLSEHAANRTKQMRSIEPLLAELARVQAELDLRVDELQAGTFAANDVAVVVRAGDGLIRTESLRATLAGGSARGDLVGRFATDSLDVQGELVVREAPADKDKEGTVILKQTLSVKGPVDNYAATLQTGTFAPRRLARVLGYTIGTGVPDAILREVELAASLAGDADSVDISEAGLTLDGQQVRISGSINYFSEAPLTLDVALPNLKLDHYIDVLLDGGGAGPGGATRPDDTLAQLVDELPNVRLSIHASDVELRRLRIRDARAEVRITDSSVHLKAEPFDLMGGRLGGEFRARVHPRGPEELSLQLDGTNLPLGRLLRGLHMDPEQVRGRADVFVDASTTGRTLADAALSLRGGVRIDPREVALVADGPRMAGGSLRLTLEPGRESGARISHPVRLRWDGELRTEAIRRLAGKWSVDGSISCTRDFADWQVNSGQLEVDVTAHSEALHGSHTVRNPLTVTGPFSWSGGLLRFGPLDIAGLQHTARVDGRYEPDARRLQATAELPPGDLKQMLTLLGRSPLGTSDPTALTSMGLSAAITATPRELVFDDLQLTMDETNLRGTVRWVHARGTTNALLQADVSGNTFNYRRYEPPDPKPDEKPDPLVYPLEFFRTTDMDLSIALAELGAYDFWFSDVQARVQAEDGKWTITPENAAFYGGQLRGQLVAHTLPEGLDISIDAQATDFAFGTLMRDVFESDRVEGPANMDLALHCVGPTDEALLRTLSGTYDLSIRDGSMALVTSETVTRTQALKKEAAKQAEERAEQRAEAKAEREGIKVKPVLPSLRDKKKPQQKRRSLFRTATARGPIRDGIVYSGVAPPAKPAKGDHQGGTQGSAAAAPPPPLIIDASSFTLTGKGTIDFVAESMDYRFLLKLPVTNVPVHISGTFDDLQTDVDTGGAAVSAVEDLITLPGRPLEYLFDFLFD